MSNVGRKYVSAIYESFECSDYITKSTAVDVYAVNDVVTQSTVAANSSAMTFTNVGTHYGQTIMINEVSIVDNYASTAVTPSFNLWLFKNKPSGLADNMPLGISDAESLTVAAVIPSTILYRASTNNLRLEAANITRQITLSTGSVDLYGVLEILSTYTPQISERFDVTIKGYRM